MRQQAPAPAPSRPHAAGRRVARPVLVVDDDDDVRRTVRSILSESGFRCVTAADGAQALRAIDDGLPTLVLLDIQMPRLDGAGFARALRTRLKNVPLVVMTGLPHPERQADRCNADGWLAKPFDADALVRLVSRFSR